MPVLHHAAPRLQRYFVFQDIEEGSESTLDLRVVSRVALLEEKSTLMRNFKLDYGWYTARTNANKGGNQPIW